MPNNPHPDAAPSGARTRILVVEDDFLIRMVLSEMLTDEGYDVAEAESGDLALPLLDGSIALLLTDLQLPGSLDGQALAALARRSYPDLPVIYTSGRSDVIVTAGRHEMAVPKPYQNADIRAAILLMLAR